MDTYVGALIFQEYENTKKSLRNYLTWWAFSLQLKTKTSDYFSRIFQPAKIHELCTGL